MGRSIAQGLRVWDRFFAVGHFVSGLCAVELRTFLSIAKIAFTHFSNEGGD
jgi:hypothetical protein